jgi:hypothetical protein
MDRVFIKSLFSSDTAFSLPVRHKYRGNMSRGTNMARGSRLTVRLADLETFDRDDREIGTYPTPDAAVAALLELAVAA